MRWREPVTLSNTHNDEYPSSLRVYATRVPSVLKHHVRCPGPQVGAPCSQWSMMEIFGSTIWSPRMCTFATPVESSIKPKDSLFREKRACCTAMPSTTRSGYEALWVHDMSGLFHTMQLPSTPAIASSAKSESLCATNGTPSVISHPHNSFQSAMANTVRFM